MVDNRWGRWWGRSWTGGGGVRSSYGSDDSKSKEGKEVSELHDLLLVSCDFLKALVDSVVLVLVVGLC